MATDNARYDGAKNKFIIPQETLKSDASRLNMTVDEYKSFLNEFIREYSQNPQFAYQHTDLSDIPITFQMSPQGGMLGTYNTETKELKVSPSRDKDRMMQTLIHELNHAAADKSVGVRSNRMNALGVSESEQKLFQDPAYKAIAYGSSELAAWMAETLHPAFASKQIQPGSIDEILRGFVSRNKEVLTNFGSRTSQPTRPITHHPKSEIEMTPLEKVMELLFSSVTGRPSDTATMFRAQDNPQAPGRRYRTDVVPELQIYQNKIAPTKFK